MTDQGKPSPAALSLNHAIKILRDAQGTPREELAKAYLDVLVAEIKAGRR